MGNKALIGILVIVCLVMGFAAGYFSEELMEEDDDDGEDTTLANIPYEQDLDPEDFEDEVDHPYFPLENGTKLIYEAETEDGTERIEVYPTGDTKIIMGITCTVVRDTVTIDDVLVEDTYDWFAQDKDGNVWYMGEDSKEYEDSEFVGTEGSWEAGVDGAYPGIIMLANPIVGLTYRQEYYEGEAEDMGAVLSLDESVVVQYGSFENVIMTRDWNPLEPDVVEHKWYAKDIGVIKEEEIGGEGEYVQLIDIVTE
jgi:hypothetical protein